MTQQIENVIELAQSGQYEKAAKILDGIPEWKSYAEMVPVRPGVVVDVLKAHLKAEEVKKYQVSQSQVVETVNIPNRRKGAEMADRVRNGQLESVLVDLEEMATKMNSKKDASKIMIIHNAMYLLKETSLKEAGIENLLTLFDDLDGVN